MFKKLFSFILIALVVSGAGAPLAHSTARAQDGGCGDAPEPRLFPTFNGQVSYTDGRPLNVRDTPGLAGNQVGQLPEGTPFYIYEGPVCADNIYWWHIGYMAIDGWIAEGASGEYFVDPIAQISDSAEGFPAENPAGDPGAAGIGMGGYDWDGIALNLQLENAPDPLTLVPPDVYRGNMPMLPVDLSNVHFLQDANLNQDQLALLAQNGFVVVPGGFRQFDDAYSSEGWDTWPVGYEWNPDVPYDPATMGFGHAYFVTTDSMLHSLHYVFDNLLGDLERGAFVPAMSWYMLPQALQAAQEQRQQVMGTPLEEPARDAELYLSVAALLLGSVTPTVISADLLPDVETLVGMVNAGSGQSELPFLAGYVEDFSQYRPRGHYAGDETLVQYFKAMMWMGRITFRAKDDTETLSALLVLRALRASDEGYRWWKDVYDTITFMIGPSDDLGPYEYGPLADELYGADLPLDKLTDPALLATFRERVNQLPGPRVNGIVQQNGTTAEEAEANSRGFRLMGQRFTMDGYLMQQLIYPNVGDDTNPRLLPLSVDVAAVFGSTEAYNLAQAAGAGLFVNYDSQMDKLRGEMGAFTLDQWLENTYSSWLMAISPLWVRNPASFPPMLNTQAWVRRDLQTGLASWTELKHDTVLYVKQPTGWGGGGDPTMTTFGYVEPNPQVFARISVVCLMLYTELQNRGLLDMQDMRGYEPGGDTPGGDTPGKDATWLASTHGQYGDPGLSASANELLSLGRVSLGFAQIAVKELNGEPLTEDEYWEIKGYYNFLYTLLYTLYQGEGEPDPVALVTDVASNPAAQTVLQEAVGPVDMIYVVVPAPGGELQVVRGGVFSYYEWIGNINERMTDEEWRAQVDAGQMPARPDWVSVFFSD